MRPGANGKRQLASLKAARRELGSLRQRALEGVSIGMSGKRADVTEPDDKKWIARFDRLIARLDEAIVYFGAK